MSDAALPQPRRPGVIHLLLVVPWVAVVIDASAPLRDNSFLWHVRAGTLQIEAGEVLTSDPFSFTMLGAPWRTQSWIAEMAYAWLEGANDGLGFVPWMMLGLGLLTFAGIGLVAYSRSRRVLGTAIVLLLSTVLMLGFLVPRPVIFSFALFVMVMMAWERPSMRWTIPFLFWLWASTHGSFALGLIYLGLVLVVEGEWRWFVVALVSGLAALGTPHGLGILEVLLSFEGSRDVLPLLTEWRRPELLSAVFIPFLIGMLLVLFGVLRRRIALRYLALVIPFAGLAFTATRAVPPSWLALIPLVALGTGAIPEIRSRGLSRVPATVGLAVIVLLPFLLRDDGAFEEGRFPESAAGHLDGLRTFHDDRAGGYLIWALGPEFGVYIDDRAELYGERMREFVEVRDGETPWQPVFARDDVQQVLLPASADLLGELRDAGWQEFYGDNYFTILRP